MVSLFRLEVAGFPCLSNNLVFEWAAAFLVWCVLLRLLVLHVVASSCGCVGVAVYCFLVILALTIACSMGLKFFPVVQHVTPHDFGNHEDYDA